VHGEAELEGGVRVDQAETEGVGRAGGEDKVVARVRSDEGHEGGDALLAGVAEAPAVVLGAVDEVQVAGVGEDRYWTEPARLGVVVHALDDEHFVAEAAAFVGLPVGHVGAGVLVADNARPLVDAGKVLQRAVRVGEHLLGDPEVAQAALLTAPLELGLGDDGGGAGAEKRAVQVFEEVLFEAVAVHVDAVGGVDFAEVGAVDEDL